MADKIRIEVLADGTLKATTGKVSAAHHANAEAFLKALAQMAGGTTTRTTKHGHAHQHAHEEDHAHEHE